MIVIAHNLQHVFSVCNRVLVLRRGTLVADLAIGGDVTRGGRRLHHRGEVRNRRGLSTSS